ncbi:protein RGF1 INDUCIBLE TRANSCRIPTION FACTOR 1-like [Impatiens glandulifera]|uniref:protein RGF1 INDUCIBLE TRANSCRIPTION FACTOR 1-like n=1 Tax=Impatiens glandulifera TaxID=253017 RepID=UPI001FB107A6|nr:protein RGF1 INDUCIBLE TRANSCRIPTION FACTOR 1-like [Impatiens glandulifera]
MDSQLPPCLEGLLTEKFFNSCLIHQESKKNEKNVFCFDCCRGICSHCLPFHSSHHLLQIRRYVYHNVIRLEDADKVVDCALVQFYSTNNAKVVFLNQRPQARLCRGSGNVCLTCDRALQDTFLFCSVSCKLHHNSLSTHTMESNSVTLLPEQHGLDDGLNTPMSVLEVVGQTITNSSGSSGIGLIMGCQAAACTAASSDVVRKKRSSVSVLREACRSISSIPASENPAVEIVKNRRRKGTPHRAPFY